MKKLLAIAVALLTLCAPTALGQYVTLSGALQASNGMPASNYVISFTPSQQGFVAGTGIIVNTATTCATSADGSVVGIPNPLVSPPVSISFSGTLPPSNYFVKYAYYDAAGNVTLVSPESQIQLSATGRIIVASPLAGLPQGVVGMKVYISTTTGTETLQGTTTGTAAYIQGSPLVSGASVPPTNTTICKQIANDTIWPTGTGYTVALTDPSGNTLPGYPMQWQLMGAGSTINLSQGLPYYHGTVFFPTPIMASPLNHQLQSISGPLTVQSLTCTGSPCANSGGTLVNVSSYPGADICAKINAAAVANPGLILDARGITGVQACSSNPFAGQAGDVVLYLGEVYIQTTAPWATNSQFMALIYGAGRGTLSTSNPHGTTIQAVAGFPPVCAGLGSACPVIRLGDFSGGPNGAFGHRFENLSVDCNGQAGTIGFYSNDIQEQSGLNHFQALNCPINGVLMDGSFGSGKGAANYTIYDGEIYSLGATTTNTVQLKIIGSVTSHASARLIENVTVASSVSVHAAAGFQFVATFTGAAIGLNSEQNTTGYDIGPGGGANAVDGLTLTSVTCGLNTTTCVWIHTGSLDVNAFTINNGGGNTTLKDDTAIPSGNTITDAFLSYMTADSGAIRWNTSHFPGNSGNGMAGTSLYLTSTNGQSAPASFRQASDHPFTMTLDSGLTTSQGQGISFLDRGAAKWFVQQTGAGGINTNAFQVLDNVNNIPRLFFSSTAFNTGYTSIQSAGSAAVQTNSGVGSGTGGVSFCSGGATPTCPVSISGAGAITVTPLAGSGKALACLDASGNLYRGMATTCP